MQISKAKVAKIIELIAPVDSLARKKAITPEEHLKLGKLAVKAVRSVLTTLRKLK